MICPYCLIWLRLTRRNFQNWTGSRGNCKRKRKLWSKGTSPLLHRIRICHIIIINSMEITLLTIWWNIVLTMDTIPGICLTWILLKINLNYFSIITMISPICIVINSNKIWIIIKIYSNNRILYWIRIIRRWTLHRIRIFRIICTGRFNFWSSRTKDLCWTIVSITMNTNII